MIRLGIRKDNFSLDSIHALIEGYFTEVNYLSIFTINRKKDTFEFNLESLDKNILNSKNLITLQILKKKLPLDKYIVMFFNDDKGLFELVFIGFNKEIIKFLNNSFRIEYIYSNYNLFNLREERPNKTKGYWLTVADKNWYSGEVLERIGKERILNYKNAIDIKEINDSVYIEINTKDTPKDKALENRLKFRDYIDINNI